MSNHFCMQVQVYHGNLHVCYRITFFKILSWFVSCVLNRSWLLFKSEYKHVGLVNSFQLNISLLWASMVPRASLETETYHCLHQEENWKINGTASSRPTSHEIWEFCPMVIYIIAEGASSYSILSWTTIFHCWILFVGKSVAFQQTWTNRP